MGKQDARAENKRVQVTPSLGKVSPQTKFLEAQPGIVCLHSFPTVGCYSEAKT